MKATLLILDDNPSYCEKVQNFFEERKYQVFPAHDAEQMWKLLRQQTPDLLILEWEFPEVSGIDIVRRLRAYQQYMNLPIIMSTGHENPGLARMAMRAGCDDLVLKEEGHDFLEQRVQRLLFRLLRLNEQEETSGTKVTVKKDEIIQEAIPKILITDDSRSYCFLLQSHLEENGYEVLTAYDSKEMWKILAEEEINLLILDWVLPNESGIEIAHRLRAHQKFTKMLIVMITGTGSSELNRLAMQAGCDDYVIKDEGPDFLEKRVRRLLFSLRTKTEEKKELVTREMVERELAVAPHKILIVDDERVLRETLARAFRREPYELHFAENGSEGVQKTREIGPDAIVLDLAMPGMGGLDVLRELKVSADSPYGVIILTGHGGDDELRECYKLGVRSFLRKPVNPIEIRGLIRHTFELNTYKRNLEDNNRLLDQKLLQRAQELELLNQTFRLFIPRQFAERAESSESGSLRAGSSHTEHMTVLFSDIRSYTRLSEKMTPQQNFDFLNDYFALMEPEITVHDGFVDKFMGDGMMALFDREKGAEHAVDSAIAMHQAINRFNEQWAEKRALQGNSAISLGIGINSGDVMIGTIGSANRLDSTVVGDTVNTAARLEQWTKQFRSKILIGENVYQEIPQDKFLLREVDKLRFRGKNRPVIIYEVFDADSADIRESKLATRTQLNSGIALYRDCKFEEAILQFQEIMKTFPHDPITTEYVRRCQHQLKYAENLENWDGVTDSIEDFIIQSSRRSAPRLPFSTDLHLLTKKNEAPISGHTYDLSRHGLRMDVAEEMSIGDIVTVEIPPDSKDASDSKNAPLNLLSQVVWSKNCQPTDESPCQVGLEFVTLSQEQEHGLHDLLLSLSMESE